MDVESDNAHVYGDWFNIEQVMFDRWEMSPFNCYQSADCAKEADAVRCTNGSGPTFKGHTHEIRS